MIIRFYISGTLRMAQQVLKDQYLRRAANTITDIFGEQIQGLTNFEIFADLHIINEKEVREKVINESSDYTLQIKGVLNQRGVEKIEIEDILTEQHNCNVCGHPTIGQTTFVRDVNANFRCGHHFVPVDCDNMSATNINILLVCCQSDEVVNGEDDNLVCHFDDKILKTTILSKTSKLRTQKTQKIEKNSKKQLQI